MTQVQRFTINTAGRDFAVGDIHGHFTKLQAALDAVGFNPVTDRLFSVGDMVDRGPESADVDVWLAKPWFFAIQGNHEQMAVDAHRLNHKGQASYMHMINGGTWLYGRSTAEQAFYVALFADLPIAIEVMTPAGLVGIVHADCPFDDWGRMLGALEREQGAMQRSVQTTCQWSRTRISNGNRNGVSGVRAVIVGHTVVSQPAVLGNVYHIDTGGWMGGHFTLIDLATLECFPPVSTSST
ncbi:metallophosphoesterase [Pseudomonas sp. 6D_7.1_Bac1]|uniref:metallophosphoesterase n=1 Tax=Pseudomonas sp. 6D_7.1_Bac1 TaxID=2971615 RepID=UPI0021C90EB8|nr:metallophosphoesterase [Pseudomonas sp. 6D_7.1_Bac1]MCU1751957.1 metallophosphoesterase [Pseudomonas sp. 6D_7.1_Bac1]